VIIGDSWLIIQALILRNKVKNAKLKHVIEKIHLLLGILRTYQLYHVLRNLNASAYAEAKKGSLSSIGTLQINGSMTRLAKP
jgi:hypothetical protein